MKFKEPVSAQDNFDILKWKVIKLTGWTLDYVDSLSIGKLYKCLQIEDGLTKAQG